MQFFRGCRAFDRAALNKAIVIRLYLIESKIWRHSRWEFRHAGSRVGIKMGGGAHLFTS